MYYQIENPQEEQEQSNLSYWLKVGGTSIFAIIAAVFAVKNKDVLKNAVDASKGMLAQVAKSPEQQKELVQLFTDRLTDPAIVGPVAQAVIPAAASTATAFWASRERRLAGERQAGIDQAAGHLTENSTKIRARLYRDAAECALRAFESYLRLYQEKPTAALERHLQQSQYLRALALAHMGYYSSADEPDLEPQENAHIILNNLITNHPLDYNARNLRGLIYVIEEKWLQAFADFKVSLASFPNQNLISIMRNYLWALQWEEPAEGVAASSSSSSSSSSATQPHTTANPYYEEILQVWDIGDPESIYAPTLIKVYAESSAALDLHGQAVAFYRLGFLLKARDPVYRDYVAHCNTKAEASLSLLWRARESGATTVTIPALAGFSEEKVLSQIEYGQQKLQYRKAANLNRRNNSAVPKIKDASSSTSTSTSTSTSASVP